MDLTTPSAGVGKGEDKKQNEVSASLSGGAK